MKNRNSIYDPELKKMTQKNIAITCSSTNIEFSGHSMVHLKSQNKVLFMGGKLRNIFIWDIINDKWSIIKGLQISESGYRYRAGIVVTKDEKYVVLFGGSQCDKIEIFDVDKQLICQSDIKCPEMVEYRAMLIDNCKQSDIIIHGYLRKIWNNEEFNNLNNTIRLIMLMIRFYANEYVHLIQINSGRHWRIQLRDLLSSCN